MGQGGNNMIYFGDIIPVINGTYLDLTRSFKVDGFLKDVHTESYVVKDGDTLDTISYEMYGDVQWWWVIALVNKFTDPFYDLPLSNESLKVLFRIYVERGIMVDIVENWESLKALNEKKRTIKVLKETYLNELIYRIQQEIGE